MVEALVAGHFDVDAAQVGMDGAFATVTLELLYALCFPTHLENEGEHDFGNMRQPQQR